jgi:hypothetical protein
VAALRQHSGEVSVQVSHSSVLYLYLCCCHARCRTSCAFIFFEVRMGGTVMRLRLHPLRVHDCARIYRQVDAEEPHLSLRVDLDIHDCGHIAEKTAVRRKAQGAPLAWLFIGPARALCHHADHASQAARIHRILVEGFPTLNAIDFALDHGLTSPMCSYRNRGVLDSGRRLGTMAVER